VLCEGKYAGIVCGEAASEYRADMFDSDQAASRACPTVGMQRSLGSASIGFVASDDNTRLDRLYQAGSARLILPRTIRNVPEAVFLNTSGGLTSGDRLSLLMELGTGTSLVATTQTAERAYAAPTGPAEVRVTARLDPGARLHWLPQETILYDHSDLRRLTEIDLSENASCLICESVVLGRHAMGETVTKASLFDRRTVRRDGTPVWIDAMGFCAEALAAAGAAAMLGAARAFGVIALIARGAEDALVGLRRVLNEPGTRAAASGWDGKCVMRVVARDGWPLRRQMIRALEVLGQAPLPRVWQM
jgi:urease accessory protein